MQTNVFFSHDISITRNIPLRSTNHVVSYTPSHYVLRLILFSELLRWQHVPVWCTNGSKCLQRFLSTCYTGSRSPGMRSD